MISRASSPFRYPPHMIVKAASSCLFWWLPPQVTSRLWRVLASRACGLGGANLLALQPSDHNFPQEGLVCGRWPQKQLSVPVD